MVAKAELARDVVFGGGAALAAVHLHHRTSEDLDFFLERPVDPAEAQAVGRSLATAAMRVDLEIVGPRTSLVLRRRASAVGRIDFAYYPFEPIGRRTQWRGLTVESLLDMHVRAKFDVGAHRMGLAARLLLVHDVRELPKMIRPVTIEDLVTFFEARVHELARSR